MMSRIPKKAPLLTSYINVAHRGNSRIMKEMKKYTHPVGNCPPRQLTTLTITQLTTCEEDYLTISITSTC